MVEPYFPYRPSDMAITLALAAHFHVEACVVVAWAKQVDWWAVTEAIAAGKVPGKEAK